MIAMSRLFLQDHVCSRWDRVLGIAPTILFATYIEGDIAEDAISRIHSFLANGALNSSIRRPKVPGAMDEWVKSSTRPCLSYSAEPLARQDLSRWIEAQGNKPLDLFAGPAWRLSATKVENGHTLVALHVHHAVTDGQGVSLAWGRALTSVAEHDLPGWGSGLAADAIDGARRWRQLARLVAKKLRTALRRRGNAPRGETTARGFLTAADLGHPLASAPTFTPQRVFVEFSSDELRRAAAVRGGTTNSLLIGIATRLLVSTGVIPDESAIQVSQRVSQRQPGDPVLGNRLGGVGIVVDVSSAMYDDLRPVRAASKEAFAGGGIPDPEPSALFPFVPDWLVALRARLRAHTASGALCTVSNLGRTDESALHVDGVRVRSIYPAFHVAKQHEARFWRRGSAIQGMLIDIGEVTIVTIEGRSPEKHAMEHDEFLEIVVQECDRWGLTPLRTL